MEPAETDGLEWTRVGAHALCVNQGEVLLTRLAPGYPDAGRWTLPGGGVEWGETPEAAVIREVKEETGLDAVLGRVLGVFSMTVPEARRGPLHFLSVVYRAVVGEAAPVPDPGDGSTDDARWFRIPDAQVLPLVPLAEYGLGLLADAALVPASAYGLVFEAANATRPDVIAAKGWEGWADLTITDLVIADRVFHASEQLIERRKIDRVAADMPTNDGNEPHILFDTDGNAHVVGGLHRVAMHIALGRTTMACRIYDVNESGPLPTG